MATLPGYSGFNELRVETRALMESRRDRRTELDNHKDLVRIELRGDHCSIIATFYRITSFPR